MIHTLVFARRSRSNLRLICTRLPRIALAIIWGTALLMPQLGFATITGVDDVESELPKEVLQRLDNDVTTYYQSPSVEKINEILDIMNETELLRKKTSWSPMVGFLTVVFADNKNHVFDWISRNDYNSHAQNVFVNALLNAKLNESALIFAQAHGWDNAKIEQIKSYQNDIDLKHQKVLLPGHIDTLWGAFFASGDEIYINEIIEVLFNHAQPHSDKIEIPAGDVQGENKRLAEVTLTTYAKEHKPVRDAILKRIAAEKDLVRKAILQKLLPHTN